MEYRFFSAERYFDIVFQMILNLKKLFDLISLEINLDTFLEDSMIKFNDFLMTKNHVSIVISRKKDFVS